jgi:nitroimidazol reductase NimA-like FMN-containing flavoprotein (pyridoxamine 5'-phosphate oxidase superfamily)
VENMREIRRKEKAIKDLDEIKDILIRTKYVTIAMSKSNSPYLVTLSHGYDKDKNCIYFHCASEGKKIEYLSDNNIIWGQAIDDMGYLDGKCNHAFKTAQFRGKVIFIDDYNEKKTALTIMINQLENNPEDILEEQLGRESSINKVTIGRIDIEDLSGKVNLE